MNKTKLYLRYELPYFVVLTIFVLVPIIAFFHFSTLSAPGLPYILIGCLFVFQYFFYKPKVRQKKLFPIIEKSLSSKKGKAPSHKEIHKILLEISNFRLGTIIAQAFLVLLVSIIYQRL